VKQKRIKRDWEPDQLGQRGTTPIEIKFDDKAKGIRDGKEGKVQRGNCWSVSSVFGKVYNIT